MDFLIKGALEGLKNSSLENVEIGKANIKVVGAGGAGNNMVSSLYKKGIQGAEIIACNTDKQHLDISEADRKFIIGANLTRGLGCGGYPTKGTEAARESLQEIRENLKGCDMVFISHPFRFS